MAYQDSQNYQNKEVSHKEKRIRSITHLYYSRPAVQKAIAEFAQNREVSPRYFEGFGKRPDTLEYPAEVMQLAKKGATSLHCSEELWEDPLELSTDLNEKQLNDLRIGWDLLIDIDSKYIDYSKISAKVIIDILKFHGIKNIGVKFSGSKGFHIIVPWKAFPKEVNGVKAKDMFPEWPKAVTQYIMDHTKKRLSEQIGEILSKENKYSFTKYIKKQDKDSEDFLKQVSPDLILVSSRHLFRMPYSLHEKTALASIVLTEEELEKFELKDADPLKLKDSEIRKFIDETKVQEGEASELLFQALDWYRENYQEDDIEEKAKSNKEFKPIKLENLSEKFFPPSVQQILKGLSDGRKRGLFILINFFRSLDMDKDELEKRIYDWNEKNEVPLKKGYLKAQLTWSYRNKIVLPPNFEKDYYKGIGVVPTQEEIRYKNPVNYTIKKTLQANKNDDWKKGKKSKKKS